MGPEHVLSSTKEKTKNKQILCYLLSYDISKPTLGYAALNCSGWNSANYQYLFLLPGVSTLASVNSGQWGRMVGNKQEAKGALLLLVLLAVLRRYCCRLIYSSITGCSQFLVLPALPEPASLHLVRDASTSQAAPLVSENQPLRPSSKLLRDQQEANSTSSSVSQPCRTPPPSFWWSPALGMVAISCISCLSGTSVPSFCLFSLPVLFLNWCFIFGSPFSDKLVWFPFPQVDPEWYN